MLSEPKNFSIPTVDDFYFDGAEDEKWAIDHYLGEDVDFAERRYYTCDPLGVVDDFRLVGVKAFRYYIFGAFRYLQSPKAVGEPDVYAAIPDILSERIHENPDAFQSMRGYLLSFCEWAIASYLNFDVDESIYGDVRAGYEELSKLVQESVRK